MSRRDDGIYERDLRDLDPADVEPWPDAQPPPPPRINYEPADDDEEYAADHFATMVGAEEMDIEEAARAYQAFVRRHRRGDDW